MTPSAFLSRVIDPGLALVEDVANIPVTDEARVLLMAISGQESGWCERWQEPGPARSYWQMERAGGVRGVMHHAASAAKLRAITDALDIPFDEATIFEAIAWNDTLAVALARLLLYTDAAPLLPVGDELAAWDCYIRCWRPGKPHRESWSTRYATATALVP